jgi:hypothetical protein
MHSSVARLRAAVVGTAVVAFIGAGLVAPGVALAATVQGVGTLDTGQLNVGLIDPSALWVQVSVHDPTDPTGPALETTDDLTYDYGIGGWDTAAPIQLPDGHDYGDYPAEVDYRLVTGTVQHWTGGVFSYREHARVTSTAWDRGFTDYFQPTAVLSGTVALYDPKTAAAKPGADLSVKLSWFVYNGGGFTPATRTVPTAADGTFSTQLTPGGAVRNSTAVVVSTDPNVVPVAEQEVPELPAHSLHTRIVTSPARVRVHSGQAFTISGEVERLTNSGWAPFDDATVIASPNAPPTYDYTPQPVLTTDVTDSTGHFTMRATAKKTMPILTYVPVSDYVVNDNYATTWLYVPTRGSLGSLVYSIDEFRYAKVSGKLYGRCAGQRLALQYSRSGSTRWTEIGAVRTDKYASGTTCGFKITGYGGIDGYYRVVHAESDQMLSVVSAGHRLHRIATRVTPFSISPTSTYRQATLTATGRVTQLLSGTWKPLGNAHVVLVVKPKGSSTWYWVVKGYTNAAGYFTMKGKTYGTGLWAVYYDADAKHFYSQSKAVEVDVH